MASRSLLEVIAEATPRVLSPPASLLSQWSRPWTVPEETAKVADERTLRVSSCSTTGRELLQFGRPRLLIAVPPTKESLVFLEEVAKHVPKHRTDSRA